MFIKLKEKVCDVRFKETLQNKGLGRNKGTILLVLSF